MHKTRTRRLKRKSKKIRKGGLLNQYNPYKTYGDNLRDWEENYDPSEYPWNEETYWPSKNNFSLAPAPKYFSQKNPDIYQRYRASRDRFMQENRMGETELIGRKLSELDKIF